jgi:hypothetical protein
MLLSAYWIKQIIFLILIIVKTFHICNLIAPLGLVPYIVIELPYILIFLHTIQKLKKQNQKSKHENQKSKSKNQNMK